MWRTVIVNEGEKLTIRDNWLVVSCNQLEQRIPVGDLYSVVIDNRKALLSTAVLTCLAEAGVHIFFCNEKHLPAALALPLNHYYKPFGVLKKQLALTDDFRAQLWANIVRQKIRNQAKCLRLAGVPAQKAEEIERIAAKVEPADKRNREGTAARKYFSALFGAGFTRGSNDVTNAALNYGYTILRSAVCKTAVAYGYSCSLGIHHINESDAFNLAEDLMEPLRPLVDLWTDTNYDNLLESLTRENRKELISIINLPMQWNGKKMRVRYIIDRMVSSLTSAVNAADPNLLILPELVWPEEIFEDDLDD